MTLKILKFSTHGRKPLSVMVCTSSSQAKPTCLLLLPTLLLFEVKPQAFQTYSQVPGPPHLALFRSRSLCSQVSAKCQRGSRGRATASQRVSFAPRPPGESPGESLLAKREHVPWGTDLRFTLWQSSSSVSVFNSCMVRPQQCCEHPSTRSTGSKDP